MLTSLLIENIAVIEQAEIIFNRGFSVLTGETGAGKSIIIDSLDAILGGRVSRELIRTGQNRACVTALFEQLPDQTRICADRLGITCDDGQLLLRRELYTDGRNTCRINGAPASLPMLRELGRTLVSIHGQHDGQHLLNEQLHIEYLDTFGGIENLLATYLQEYEALLRLNRRLRASSMSAEEQEKRKAQLPSEIERLRNASVRPGEQEELLTERSRLHASQQVFESLSTAAEALDGSDDNPAGVSYLSICEKALRAADQFGVPYGELHKHAQELHILATDLSGTLADLLSRLDYSREQLELTERRLAIIEKLSARFGVNADGLEEHLSVLENEFSALSENDGGLEQLKAEYASQRQRVYDLAGELHAKRVTASQALAERIETELRELDMPSVKFCAQVEDLRSGNQAHFNKRGTDNVRFLLSTNAGEELKPLAHVASGGELSRVMLALINVLGAREKYVSAVFDEIDAGVSGRAATRVGEKLYDISGDRQVLCVTHLPQIASLADSQYHISKHSRNGRTFTEVTQLDSSGRVEELARLTAGLHITQATMRSAEELLRQAEEYKKNLTK